ncbi:HAMP domain-containing sensor histidine kinase [Nocardioides bigeumensis]|uniref:histidine kinase n=1 Tax=Nocardioides bigeumensis TaxID=433657 RepID=A0ABN2XNI8_9ACTN
MTALVGSDQVQIVLIAVAWSGGAGVVGLGIAYLLRRRSVPVLSATVALVAVGAVIAGIIGTARAMFLSSHDFRVTLMVAAIAGVVAVLVATLVGRVLSRWSRQLADETRRFGASGEFVASGSSAPVELRQLAAELERTSERLAQSRARERRLEEARRELVAWVSHDLRTPLAGLRAMTEALEDGIAPEPERYHRQIRAEVDRMTRMVDDLFELSRIHSGTLELSPQSLLLGDLVSEAIAGADPVARVRGVRLGGRVEEGIEVHADAQGLSRVLSNLVMNAIRHTPSDGTVEIVGRQVAGAVELSVTDACGGIPDADRERVFDVAWRGVDARTPAAPGEADDRTSGAGLGLAIVKGIVEAHSGQVSVENLDAPPAGCRFLVRLPAPA